MSAGEADGAAPGAVRFTIGHLDLRRAFATMGHAIGNNDLEWWIEADRLVLVGQAREFSCEASIRYLDPPVVAPGVRLVLRGASEFVGRVLCSPAIKTSGLSDLNDPGAKLEVRYLSPAPGSREPEEQTGIEQDLWRVVLGAIRLTREFQRLPPAATQIEPRAGEAIEAVRLAQLITHLVPFAQPDRRDGDGVLVVADSHGAAASGSRMRVVSGVSFPGLILWLRPRVANLLGQTLIHFDRSQAQVQVQAGSVTFADGRYRCRVAAPPGQALKLRELPPVRPVFVQTADLSRAITNILLQVGEPTLVRFRVLEPGAEGLGQQPALVIEVDLPGRDVARATCPCALEPDAALSDAASTAAPPVAWQAMAHTKDLNKLTFRGGQDAKTEVRLTAKHIVFIHTHDGMTTHDWFALERGR